MYTWAQRTYFMLKTDPEMWDFYVGFQHFPVLPSKLYSLIICVWDAEYTLKPFYAKLHGTAVLI